jgi:hypothetical protein
VKKKNNRRKFEFKKIVELISKISRFNRSFAGDDISRERRARKFESETGGSVRCR